MIGKYSIDRLLKKTPTQSTDSQVG